MVKFAFPRAANTFYSLGELKRLWFRVKIPNIDQVIAILVHFGQIFGLRGDVGCPPGAALGRVPWGPRVL